MQEPAPEPARPSQVRLWVSEPARATAIARVAAASHGWLELDRALFAPTSRRHRHPQPHDQGTAWWEGEKRWVEKAVERDGRVLVRVAGAAPPVGAQLNCQLDQERRRLASRAHTAMHLLLAAFAQAGAGVPPMVADPQVKGGGTFRLDFGGPLQPRGVADALATANAGAARDLPVRREPILRVEAARRLAPQAFLPPDPFPGPPDVVDAVFIEGVGGLPCDGTHVARTGQVGRIVVQSLRAGRRSVLVGAVRDPA